MARENKKERLQIFYVRWDGTKPFTCSNCGSEIKFIYNNGGRHVITLAGKIKLYINYYACQNETCKFSAPFTLPQNIVIPHKHYGLDVWTWIITSHVEFHDSYKSIAARLEAYYRLGISPNTVKSIIETYLAANSMEADVETSRRVKDYGKIFLALDGQRPNNGECGLWLFIDTITDRIVHMEYIKSATWKVLAGIFRKIESKYGVKIAAVLSDHQRSILKAVENALPGIPHQFCHYHFIRNLHRTIEALDSHLHLELSMLISKMHAGKQGMRDTLVSVNGLDSSIRDFLDPILEDLRTHDARKSRAFDYFSGHELYKNLESYVESMDCLINKVRSARKLCRMLEKMQGKLQTALLEQKTLFSRVEKLIPFFNELRAILGHSPPRHDKIRAEAGGWVRKIRAELLAMTGKKRTGKLKYKRITYQSPLEGVLEEWVRLYSSHEAGLFHYCKLPGLPRTNVALEQLFSIETRHFRETSGNALVGHMIRVKGGEVCQAILNYDPDSTRQTLVESDRQKITSKIQEFRSRQKEQSRAWHFKSKPPPNILAILKKLEMGVSAGI